MRYILIDNDRLRFIKQAESVHQLEYWAELLIPAYDFTITTMDEKKRFSTYTQMELRHLYYNTTGDQPTDKSTFGDLLGGVLTLAQRVPLDETSLDELKARLGREVKTYEIGKTPEGDTKPPAPTVAHISKPREGTTTGRVWQIADIIVDTSPDTPDKKTLRKLVVEACEAEGINSSTAATQFGKWFKWKDQQKG